MTDTDRLRVFSFDHTAPAGGVTTYQLRLAVAFDRYPELGIDFHYIGNGAQSQLAHLLEQMPPSVRQRATFLNREFNTPLWTLRRWLEGDPQPGQIPDVVLPHNSMEGWLYADFMSKLHGSRRPGVVGTMHSDELRYYQMCGEQGPCDVVTGVSSHICAEFARRFERAAPVTFLPYGVPTVEAPPERPRQGPVRLSYLGSLSRHQKRAQDLLPLVAALTARGVDYELHIAGDGQDRQEIIQGVGEVAGQRMHYHGRISLWDVPKFYADKHLFIQTSDFEGTSISLLEAMGCGVVPVVTDVASGVPDVIRQGVEGWRVPIGDMSAMADRITELARHREKIALAAQEAWRTVSTRYSLRTAAEHLAECCRQACRRKKGPFRVSSSHPQLNRLDRCFLPNSLVSTVRRLRVRRRAW